MERLQSAEAAIAITATHLLFPTRNRRVTDTDSRAGNRIPTACSLVTICRNLTTNNNRQQEKEEQQ